MVKLVASENANKAADLGIQILGGMGYSAKTEMRRYWRDSRLWRIGPITNAFGSARCRPRVSIRSAQHAPAEPDTASGAPRPPSSILRRDTWSNFCWSFTGTSTLVLGTVFIRSQLLERRSTSKPG